MNDTSLLFRLVAALAIGLLIGLERGWKQREEAEGERTAGLRTYTLTALLGALSAVLTSYTSTVFLAFSFLGFALAFSAFSWLEAKAEENFSVTGVVAGLITFALGAYAVLGNLEIATAAGVVVTLILALKQPLHRWVRNLTWLEIRSALILLAMTFLALPLLPDRTVDPWNAINPFEIWLLAIIIAAISFVGYIAVKIMGSQAGVALAALAGGLASSTATTVTLARLAREHPAASPLLAGGILLSGSVMIARVLVVASVLNNALLVPLAWPLGAGGLVMIAVAGLLFFTHGGGSKEHPQLGMKSPFDLGTALKLAGLIAVISLLAKVIGGSAGDVGITILAALSGIADVDAITLSLARLANNGITPVTAALGIGIAVAVNTVVKAGMTFSLGTGQAGWIVSGASGAAIAAGGAAFAVFG
ncbi:MgtC/SapB family protein [Microvirga mediterraneensis]|uniref:MgtC/SapB family protein n=1 Tax=Microvirga mediterraneensis TaxID=2754695 RepID=A0A838BU03_9HYPH|nr:MgtC/SapB family protein [Microvirga mediterraneensis]MBA1158393.1 MgtC/SapB family protein [Microvirga mediterraneensis]